MAGTTPSREPRPARVLLLAAHPDDEFGVAVALRAHAQAGAEVHAAWFARDDRPHVGQRREAEARTAMALIGVPDEHLTMGTLEPKALSLQLPELVSAVRERVAAVEPDLVYVPAYEGGNPDHDAVNFAAWEVCASRGVETLEFPLFSAAPQRRILRRLPAFARFVAGGAGEPHVRWLHPRDVDFKRRLWTVYRSQRPLFDVLLRMSGDERRYFSTESTRPIPMRDYTKPPHERPLLYERHTELSYTFDEFAEKVRRYYWSGGVSEDESGL